MQECLQKTGALRRDEILSYRNSIDRLAHYRDEIVHKGMAVTESECRELISGAVAFVSHYSRQLLGGDILG